MKVLKTINILTWFPKYKKEDLRGDIFAGLTVGVLLIPQGMAYAIIAGLPPVYGLYASLTPLIVYSILGTSRQLSIGPSAMDSLLVASFVSTLAVSNTDNYFSIAITLALFTGLIQLLFGILKLGFIVNFLSKPVISGFTSAAAIIIGLSQLKHLLGINIETNNQIHVLISAISDSISSTHLLTLGIGALSIAIIILSKKISKSIPTPLIVVVLFTSIVYLFNLNTKGINIIGEIPQGLPAFKIPTFDLELIKNLFPMALTLALVAFMEAVSVAKSMQNEENEVKPNNELIALGAANFIGSLFQSFPTTGGFSRSAVNFQAGAKTQLSSLISAALIILTLLFLTPLFYYLPKTVLSAIIMVAVYNLIDIKYPIELLRSRKTEFLMLITTFILTLSFSITVGIIAGVLLSLIVMIYLSTKPHTAVLGRIPNTNQFRNINRFKDLEIRKDVSIIRFDSTMYFANSQFIKDKIFELIKNQSELKLVIINMESVGSIDSSAMNNLSSIKQKLNQIDVDVYFTGLIGPVRDTMNKYGFIKIVGKENFFLDIQFALEYFETHLKDEKTSDMAIQTNFSD